MTSLQATTVRTEHVQTCPEIGPICAQQDEPPQVHDQRFWIGQVRFFGTYAFDSRWSVEVQGQLKLLRSGITYRDLEGREFVPPYIDIHHRNETLFGLTDPWLLGRWTAQFSALRTTLRGGVTAPLGSTQENPFERGMRGAAHQHLQFGTGTWDPVLGGELAWREGALGILAYGVGLVSLYDNRHGYRSGARVAGGLAFSWALSDKWTLQATSDVMHEGAETWGGVRYDEGNLGRTDVLVGGGASARLGGLRLGFGLRVPVFTKVHATGGTIEIPALLEFTLAPL